MSLIDKIKDAALKVMPEKKQAGIKPLGANAGIGNGVASFDDELPLSKPAIVAYVLQIFFAFLAMCCFASVASFQRAKGIGVSGLSGLAIFAGLTSMLLSGFMLLVPVAYDKYDKFARLARAIREERPHFILSTTGVAWMLLISFTTLISAFTQAGCKNPANDPHAKLGKEFQLELAGWCITKKAGSFFFLFAFFAWAVTFTVGLKEWRSGKVRGRRPRDPPFTNPVEHSREDSAASSYYPARTQPQDTTQRPLTDVDEEDEEPGSPFNDSRAAPPTRYGAGPPPSLPPVDVGGPRGSMDQYGAFSDPVPSGYQEPGPRISRTMQYADPYAAVRTSIAPHGGAPPSYPY